MRLLVKYMPNYNFNFSYQLIPIEWSSKENLINDFKRAATYANDEGRTDFYIASIRWLVHDFFSARNNFKYDAPEILTIDDFFKEVEPYTSDGMS